MADINAAEKQAVHSTDRSSDSLTHEKAGIAHEETAHEAAVRGHLATDQYVLRACASTQLADMILDMAMRWCISTLSQSANFDSRSISTLCQQWRSYTFFASSIELTSVCTSLEVFRGRLLTRL